MLYARALICAPTLLHLDLVVEDIDLKHGLRGLLALRVCAPSLVITLALLLLGDAHQLPHLCVDGLRANAQRGNPATRAKKRWEEAIQTTRRVKNACPQLEHGRDMGLVSLDPLPLGVPSLGWRPLGPSCLARFRILQHRTRPPEHG